MDEQQRLGDENSELPASIFFSSSANGLLEYQMRKAYMSTAILTVPRLQLQYIALAAMGRQECQSNFLANGTT